MTAGPPDDAACLADARAHLAARARAARGRPGPDAEALRARLPRPAQAERSATSPAHDALGRRDAGRQRDVARAARRRAAAPRRRASTGRCRGSRWSACGRLDDLQACVESVVADGVEGDLIEAGAWRGGASILMRATLDSLGDERTVWVADSFQGFPADGRRRGRRPLSAFDFLAVPLEEVRDELRAPRLERGVRFLPGLLRRDAARPRRPALGDRPARRRHLRGRRGSRSSACTRGLTPGGYLIIDDYGSFPGCRRAVDEFRARARDRRADREGRLRPASAGGARATRRSRRARPAGAGRRRGRRAAPRAAAHVPTARELELARERDARARAPGGGGGADRTAAVAAAQAAAGRPAMIVFASSITDPDDVLAASRSPGSAAPRSPTPR